MGIASSLQALASVLPPLLAGSIASATTPPIAVLIAVLFNFLAWAAFVAFYRAPRGEPAAGS